jgi:membrane associated rhomboid family serine protease
VIYELALISVVIGAGYWGWFFVRQRPHGTATFGIMQLAAAGLAGLGVLGHRLGIGWLGIPGAIGLGGGACLLLLGPLVRVAARWQVAAERMSWAMRLLDLAELLAPGSGVAEEKALVRAMSEIREGRIEHTVDALSKARDRASAEARLAIDERIAMLYLAAYRWHDAIAYAEANLFGAPPPLELPGSLRGALGIAPPIWVDLLAAYGRTGDLDQAARMLIKLEDACAGREDAALWLHRGRLMFLALAGRPEAVRVLVAPRRARHMSTAARTYWLAVAHEHHGDRAEAAHAYEKARSRSRGRPREQIDQALARLAEVRRTELAAVASEVVARVEAAPLPPPVRLPRPPTVRPTWVLTAIVLAVGLTAALAVGDSNDLGVLVRIGAQGHGLVASGEWWRLISCLFVHIGIAHLAFNALGLIVLGWLTEDLFGSSRMVAIFAVSGVAGALASHLASPIAISAGASGAVLGLLGAVFVELTWHRARHRMAWRRGLWGALAVVAIGELGCGLITSAIDQWAHGAGLLAGAALGVLLSPSARWVRAGTMLARALTVAFAAVAVFAAIRVIETPLATTLARGGDERRVVEGVAMHVPAHWDSSARLAQFAHGQRSEAVVVEPDGLVELTAVVEPRVAPVKQLELWNDEQRKRIEQELGKAQPASDALVELPAGWNGSELVLILPEDPMGYRERWRVVVCVRAFGDRAVFAAIYVPETIAAAAPGFVAQLLASLGPA